MDKSRFVALLAALEVAHHIPGRLRLKLAQRPTVNAPSLGEVQQFVAQIGRAEGIRRVTLNPLARSCTVEYQHATIPAAAWHDLLGGKEGVASDHLLSTLLACART